uniref:Uncharacterized protein n=1 Tax=Lepeophtheirus salmonis TaxID=72036 RepID=A0A0K2UY06_LEPSM
MGDSYLILIIPVAPLCLFINDTVVAEFPF